MEFKIVILSVFTISQICNLKPKQISPPFLLSAQVRSSTNHNIWFSRRSAAFIGKKSLMHNNCCAYKLCNKSRSLFCGCFIVNTATKLFNTCCEQLCITVRHEELPVWAVTLVSILTFQKEERINSTVVYQLWNDKRANTCTYCKAALIYITSTKKTSG